MKYLFFTIFGFITAYLYENIGKHIVKREKLVVGGFRLHHSLYGLVFIALGLVNISFIFFGLGILIQHTLTDGFRFLSKE